VAAAGILARDVVLTTASMRSLVVTASGSLVLTIGERVAERTGAAAELETRRVLEQDAPEHLRSPRAAAPPARLAAPPRDARPWVAMTRVDSRRPAVLVDGAARSRLARALDRDPVIAAYLFGSQARGTAGPLSDVDLAVWSSSSGDPAVQLELAALAGEAVRSASDVELVVLDRAPVLLRHRVLRDGLRLVDRDPRERVRREAATLCEYLDTQWLRDELSRAVSHRLDEDRFGRP